MSAKVLYSHGAARAALDAGIWWRTHHTTNANLFDEELEKAIEILEISPEAGARARTKRYKNARIIVLRKSGHLVIYRCVSKTEVLILDVLVSKKTRKRP